MDIKELASNDWKAPLPYDLTRTLFERKIRENTLNDSFRPKVAVIVRHKFFPRDVLI